MTVANPMQGPNGPKEGVEWGSKILKQHLISYENVETPTSMAPNKTTKSILVSP